jgi:hypothetical protein
MQVHRRREQDVDAEAAGALAEQCPDPLDEVGPPRRREAAMTIASNPSSGAGWSDQLSRPLSSSTLRASGRVAIKASTGSIEGASILGRCR